MLKGSDGNGTSDVQRLAGGANSDCSFARGIADGNTILEFADAPVIDPTDTTFV